MNVLEIELLRDLANWSHPRDLVAPRLCGQLRRRRTRSPVCAQPKQDKLYPASDLPIDQHCHQGLKPRHMFSPR